MDYDKMLYNTKEEYDEEISGLESVVESAKKKISKLKKERDLVEASKAFVKATKIHTGLIRQVKAGEGGMMYHKWIDRLDKLKVPEPYVCWNKQVYARHSSYPVCFIHHVPDEAPE